MIKRFWDQFNSFEEAEKAWDNNAKKAQKNNPPHKQKNNPKIPGITKSSQKWLKLKTLKYMLFNDKKGMIWRNFFKHPIKYFTSFVKSCFGKTTYLQDENLFFYNVKNIKSFEKLLKKKNSILVLGFAYCHKPYECPVDRFNDKCIHDFNNTICQQCFIGKAINALPKKNVLYFIIPTAHYIGEKVFNVVHQNPGKSVFFIITACELSLRMFADWGNMLNIKGIGIRLNGRFCNTFQAFELAEKGIKPGLTTIPPQIQKQILHLIQIRRNNSF